MRKYLRNLIAASSSLLILEGCQKQDVVAVQQPSADNFSSKIAVTWMHTLQRVVQTEGVNPPKASRIYAYAGIGLYEAVLPGMRGYQSLQGQIADLGNLPRVQMFGKLDYTCTANESLYQISLKIFDHLKPENLALIDSLHLAVASEAGHQIENNVFEELTAFGRAVAMAVMNRAE